MKAVWYERTGPAPEVLVHGETPTPMAGPGEVRVRLEASGSFSAMVAHRVRLESVTEVDRVLVGWLKQAYDAAK